MRRNLSEVPNAAAKKSVLGLETTVAMLYATQDSRLVSLCEPHAAPACTQGAPSALPSAWQNMLPVVRVALETARIDRELTLKELSDLTGIPTSALHSYESGSSFPRAGDIATLEEHLEVKIAPR